LKHAILGAVIAAMLVGLLACGGSSTSAPSGLSNRVLVSNSLSTGTFSEGTIQIIDATNNTLSGSTITAGSAPGLMAVSPGLDRTLVFDSGSNDVSILDNSTESNAAFVSLTGFTESLIAKDTNTGFAAVPTAGLSNQVRLGAVEVLDLVNAVVATVDVNGVGLYGIPVPGARRMVMNSQGTKLLVFSDNYRFTPLGAPLCSDGSSAMTVIDVSEVTLTGSAIIPTYPSTVCGFDQAVWGVFSSDGNTAYILNCGPECGGTKLTASVQPFDLTTLPSASSTTPVQLSKQLPSPVTVPGKNIGATIGMLSGSTLYVAGTPGGTTGAGAGVLNVFDVSATSSTTLTPDPNVQSNLPISDGYHTRMVMGANNKLFVGAINCTNDASSSQPTGCLSIYDTGANTKPVIDAAKGYVTGMVPIATSDLVYVIEGNRLNIYDTTTSAESTTYTINIVGTLVDVKAIDQPQ